MVLLKNTKTAFRHIIELRNVYAYQKYQLRSDGFCCVQKIFALLLDTDFTIMYFIKMSC